MSRSRKEYDSNFVSNFFRECKDQNPENDICFECGDRNTRWISIPYGIYLCYPCSGKHRGLGTHLSFVRSQTMDKLTEKQLLLMSEGGNIKCQLFFNTYGVAHLNFLDKYNSIIARAYRDKLDIETEGGIWEEPEEFIQIRQNVELQNEDKTIETQEEEPNPIINNSTPSIWTTAEEERSINPTPSIWATAEEERSESFPNNNNSIPSKKGGRVGIRVGGKAKAQENQVQDPNFNYTPPFSSEINPFANSDAQSKMASSKGIYSDNLTMGLFEGLVLNSTSNSPLDNSDPKKLNNDTPLTQVSGNGYKPPLDYMNMNNNQMEIPSSNTQNQNNLFAMEINPFDNSPGTPLSVSSNNIYPDPFAISTNNEHNGTINGTSNNNNIDPFLLVPNSEPPTTESDTQPGPKQDTQPRSLFSPEHVRDPFGLEIEHDEPVVQTKQSESIIGKIGKFFFKK